MYFTKINNKVTCVFDGEYNILDIPEGIRFVEGSEINLFVQFNYCDTNKAYNEIVKTVVTHFRKLNIDGTKGYQISGLPSVEVISIDNANTKLFGDPRYHGQHMIISNTVIQEYRCDYKELDIESCDWVQSIGEHYNKMRIRDSKLDISGNFGTLEIYGNNQLKIRASAINTLYIVDSIENIDIIMPNTEPSSNSITNRTIISDIDANILNINKLGLISDDIKISDVTCGMLILTNPSKCILQIEDSSIEQITIYEEVFLHMDEIISSNNIHIVNSQNQEVKNKMATALAVVDKIIANQELTEEEINIFKKMLQTYQIDVQFQFVPFVCKYMLEHESINIVGNCIFLTGKNIQQTIESLHILFIESKKQNKMDIFGKILTAYKGDSTFDITFKSQYSIFGSDIDEFLSIFTKMTKIEVFENNNINPSIISIILDDLEINEGINSMERANEIVSRLNPIMTDDVFNMLLDAVGKQGPSKNKIAFILLLVNKNPQYSLSRYIKEAKSCTTWIIGWLTDAQLLTDELISLYVEYHAQVFFTEYVGASVSTILTKSHTSQLFDSMKLLAFESDETLMLINSSSLITVYKLAAKTLEEAKYCLVPMMMNQVDDYIKISFSLSQVITSVILDEEYVSKIKSLNVIDKLKRYTEQYGIEQSPYINKRLIYSNDDLTKINSLPLVAMIDKEKNKRKNNVLYKKEKRDNEKLYIDTVYEQKSKYSKGTKEHAICIKVEEKIQNTTKNYITIEDLVEIDEEFKQKFDNVEIFNTTIKSPFLNLILQFNNNLTNFYDEILVMGTTFRVGDSDIKLDIAFDKYNGEQRKLSHIYADETMDLFSKVENILYIKYQSFVNKFRDVYDRKLMEMLQNEFIEQNTDILTYQQVKALDSKFEKYEQTKIINDTLDQVYDILTNMRNMLIEERGCIVETQSLGKIYHQRIMRLNLKSMSLLNGIDNKQLTILQNSIKNYIDRSGHPTSKKYLTVGWVRFIIDEPSKGIWVNEIQTDMTKICHFESSGSGMSDKLNDKIALNLLLAFKKLVFKFYDGYTIFVPSAKLRKILINGSPTVNTYDNPAKKLKFKMGQYSDTPWIKKQKGNGIVYIFNTMTESKKL